jgi:hypothetical protein
MPLPSDDLECVLSRSPNLSLPRHLFGAGIAQLVQRFLGRVARAPRVYEPHVRILTKGHDLLFASEAVLEPP